MQCWKGQVTQQYLVKQKAKNLRCLGFFLVSKIKYRLSNLDHHKEVYFIGNQSSLADRNSKAGMISYHLILRELRIVFREEELI